MLATSTHDTKRSEDVRARINVLSEMPQEWREHLMRWRDIIQTPVHANDQYLLYQTLIGAWIDHGTDAFINRIEAYMLKAAREAKARTSWAAADGEYEDALMQFIRAALERREGNLFLADFCAFNRRIVRFGLLNVLSQTLLKLTAPGVPDIYQGNELWDFSLVDPDNRRPVDYGARQQAVGELLKREHEGDLSSLLIDMLQNIGDGRAKLWTTMRALRFRREHNELFRRGTYTPVFASNHFREHVVAFARQLQEKTVITAVPRFTYTLMNGEQRFPLGEDVWKDAALKVPEHVHTLENVLTDATLHAKDGHVLCREVFARFPVALLTTV